MTREEEIKCAASRFAENCTDNDLDGNHLTGARFREGYHDGFIRGANWADNYPRNGEQKQAMDAWVARDEDGTLVMYDNDPHKWRDYFYSSGNKRNSYIKLPTYMFPKLTFENSPIKIRLVFEV